MRQEHQRRRQAAFGFVEVMLRDPGRIEAASLGLHDLRGGQSIPLCGARLVEQAREEPQTLRHAAKLARTDHSCKAKHISCVLHGADWYNLCIVPSVPSVSRWEDVLFACAFLMRTFSIQDGVRLPLSAPLQNGRPYLQVVVRLSCLCFIVVFFSAHRPRCCWVGPRRPSPPRVSRSPWASAAR